VTTETQSSEKSGNGKFLNRRGVLLGIALGSAIVAAVTASLITSIFQRKVEATKPYVRVVDVGENDTDPAKWGRNWPSQYDSYKQTARHTSTRFGGHGGSETLPTQKSEKDKWLTQIFLGYAFSIDYRDRRGHAYMLNDQEATKRLTKPQSGSCLHCHASIMPVYRELGGGDAMKGFETTFKLSYQELNKKVHDMGHAHPVSCVDCHNPKTMALRVTRPGFLRGIDALARSKADVPALPSIQVWRNGNRKQGYDPNVDASRNEMRSFVCGQCHVEYYCSSKMPLTFPWGKGLKVEDIEAFWDGTKFPDGSRFSDFNHKETGAEVLKAQHPEFETWNQGIHARNGVSCADCHMPYMREGATKVSDHWVRSPLLNINRSCQTCHRSSEQEMLGRVDVIQSRHNALMQRAGSALVNLIDAIKSAKERGATSEELKPILEFQRKSQWRLDYVAAENSMGFHAPQEGARTLGEAIDYARQGQVMAVLLRSGSAPPPPTASAAVSASASAPPGAPKLPRVPGH
jgi:nitrite reductase (cytochrome c-552)